MKYKYLQLKKLPAYDCWHKLAEHTFLYIHCDGLVSSSCDLGAFCLEKDGVLVGRKCKETGLILPVYYVGNFDGCTFPEVFRRIFKEPNQMSKPLGLYNLCTGTKDKPKVLGQIHIIASSLVIFDSLIQTHTVCRKYKKGIRFHPHYHPTDECYIALDTVGFSSVKSALKYYNEIGIEDGTLCYVYEFCLANNPQTP